MNLEKLRKRSPGYDPVSVPSEQFNQICRLTKFINNDMLKVLKPYYAEKHRHFHTLDHLIALLEDVETLNSEVGFRSETEYKSFQCAVLFHDVVYNPRSSHNEKMSELFFQAHKDEYPEVDTELVSDLILGTALLDDSNASSAVRTFNRLDRQILIKDTKSLIQYGEKIWKEYSFLDYSKFLDGHFKLIRELVKNSFGYICFDNKENIDEYERHMRAKNIRVGLYVGSFNPFHVGHLDILTQAEALFDKVIVAVGTNPDKVDKIEPEDENPFYLEGVPTRFQQSKFSGMLLARYVDQLKKEQNYDVTIIRGFRDGNDIASELTQRKYSLNIDHTLKYVFLTSAPGLEHVSSSGIRSLLKFGEDVSEYLPNKTRRNYLDSERPA